MCLSKYVRLRYKTIKSYMNESMRIIMTELVFSVQRFLKEYSWNRPVIWPSLNNFFIFSVFSNFRLKFVSVLKSSRCGMCIAHCSINTHFQSLFMPKLHFLWFTCFRLIYSSLCYLFVCSFFFGVSHSKIESVSIEFYFLFDVSIWQERQQIIAFYVYVCVCSYIYL